jgi:hypothetical protein
MLKTRFSRCAFMPSGAGHGLVALFGCFVFVFLSGAAFASFGRRHIDTVFAVRRKNSMESGQVHSRLGNQGSQFADEIQRLENDMRGSRPKALAALMGPAFIVGRFELVADIA